MHLSYSIWVGIGMAAAFLMSRWHRDTRPELLPHRHALHLAAVIGAIAGAYLCELPADYFGWTWRPATPVIPATPVTDVMPLGGRTVLGGILGGWLAVELLKWRRGIRGPTGDHLALPLAIALAFGRMGCASAGCCSGKTCATDLWWLWHGRYPVQFIEVAFHLGSALTLWWAAQRRIAVGQHLTIYLAAYAVVRFALEFARENPVVALGLTWYQMMAVALAMLAGITWWRRRLSLETPP